MLGSIFLTFELLFSFLGSFCQVGSRIVKAVDNCTKTFESDLYLSFCTLNETLKADDEARNKTTNPYTEADYVCDEYFTANEANVTQGIKGLASGIFFANVANKYHDKGDALSDNEIDEPEYNLGGKAPQGYITSDIYTTFTLLVGIFFPSCTGEI